MGDLPKQRVKPERLFSSAGLDYAGPFLLRTTKGLKFQVLQRIHMPFHLHDHQSGALGVFVSRRGVCSNLYSDNATSFRGAARELKAIFKKASPFYEEVDCQLKNEGTQWKFIPPYSPHFGGLWEAAIKFTTYHLRRVSRDQILSFEEMTTLLYQIEA
ncbi:hypothetical protein J437_LFUL018964 [Ladona fulva]|uniref:Integrase catalytic domain-containing protein n=1 Tax=Ladona fulva TaxID=123851 RepID=A0A8K0KPZ2_LADFU|nr:hypothetical protein J437_LFUL018964 [Ladona fulva]